MKERVLHLVYQKEKPSSFMTGQVGFGQLVLLVMFGRITIRRSLVLGATITWPLLKKVRGDNILVFA